MAGFYRAFITSFATISQPLKKLASDNVKFIWDSTCEALFQKITQHLISELILEFPKLNEQFVVEVDASGRQG